MDPVRQPKMELASSSAVMKQPNMESDSADAFSNMQNHSIVELQEVVSEPLSDKFKFLLSQWETCFRQCQNRSKKTPCTDLKNLIFNLKDLSYETRNLVGGAEREHDFLVKLWLADLMEVLSDMDDILDEIMDANKSRLAELRCANKPWKLIFNLFSKVSGFMHYYREKKILVSMARDTGVRIQRTLEEAISLGLQSRLSAEDKFEPKNLGRKQYDILNAIYKGKFGKVRDFVEDNPDAISTRFENGQTVLHVAITAGQLMIAKELITRTSTENKHHLGIKDKSGNTALSFAARSGMMEIAKCLVKRNEDLLTIPDANNKIPVQLACSAGHEDMTRYLYRETPQKFLDGDYGFDLLKECITNKTFDIALHLLHHFLKFATYRFFNGSYSAPMIISILARTPPPFYRGNQLVFWRRWIYNRIRVKVDKRSVLSDGVGLGLVAAQRTSGTWISILLKFLAKQIYDIKLMDATAHEIIHLICQLLSTLDECEFQQSGALDATFEAIENGILDIVIEITKVNTNIWNQTDFRGWNLLASAVVHRQEEVAQFLYGFNARIGTNIVFTTDGDGNNLLHLAAKLAPHSHLDGISGAALQLQSELRWFKAVEGIVPQFFNYDKNCFGKTPSELFLEEHKQLLKEAEEWMKKTAESSTIVGALIITIMFAVAFTVPGGNDQNTGFPIFLNKTTNYSIIPFPTHPFMVFIASDAISLFAASSSVLMFLGILTSRYANKDFLKPLPVKLIVGMSLLFISIAAMMVAFCVALCLMLQRRFCILIPVALFAGIPVIIFALLQFPFLVELCTSTFKPGIFDGKRTST